GIPAALASVSGTVGVAAFASVGYGWSRTETGSHVDVKGTSADVGVAFGTETGAGPLVAGVFLEFGDGSFDSYNDFAGIAGVHGEGDLSYIGGGAFARLDFGQPEASHPYFEASVRFGKTDAEFKTRDFLASAGDLFRYDFDAKYWGFHAGGGYVIDFSGIDASLDLSAKYFHLHRDGGDFTAFGQRATLSSVTSSRVKVGGRLKGGITQSIKGYFGLYYEHEFNGDSRVTYGGVAIPEATLSGSTGVGELGLIVSTPDSPLEVQMGIEGSAGRRDSISANLSLRVTF
ncbi:MAG: autotransporter outer membrane beta-barrel domain-containing protein, partial [Deltaproteobacteria bacterium]|nr:autotransporter outer membrane beta-barrel domain-containing protein [Deltaproteobacteria bacterium]